MLNYLKKGQIAHFVQVYIKKDNKNPEDKGIPKIKCYSQDDFQWRLEKKRAVGYGNISITADNFVHLWAGKRNLEHLRNYRESRELRALEQSKKSKRLIKNNLLKILIH